MTDLTCKQILDAMRESVKEAVRVAGAKSVIKKRPPGPKARRLGALQKRARPSRARGK